jgi:hypothetical protein
MLYPTSSYFILLEKCVNSRLRSDQISIIDDLAFAMYQDPDIAAIIKNLDRKKQECVHGTPFPSFQSFYSS